MNVTKAIWLSVENFHNPIDIPNTMGRFPMLGFWIQDLLLDFPYRTDLEIRKQGMTD